MNNIDFKSKEVNNTNIFLLVLNILFFVYYCVLAFYTRPHSDDLHFLWKLKQMSIGEFVSDMYFSRSGRFIGYFINGIVFKSFLFIGEYRFFPILFWLIGIGMCWYVAKSFFHALSSFLILNAVLLFYNLFVLTNIDFAVFNWLCAMTYYLLAPILIVTIKLVNVDKLKLNGWIILIILSIVLGGVQETFTPIALAALLFNGLFIFRGYHYKVKDTWNDIRIRRIICAVSIIIICLLIVVIAPGNFVRLNASEFVSPVGISGYILGFSKAIITFFYFIIFYLPYYLVLAILFILIGGKYSRDRNLINISYKSLIVLSLQIYFFYLLLSVTPSVYLWSSFGIQRNYTHVVFFTMFFICFQAFIFGYFQVKLIRHKLVVCFMNIGLLILSCIMIINLFNDSISARKYAKSVDDRIELLERLNKNEISGLVSVDPIIIPYTIDSKYLFYRLLGKKKNPQSVLYYISDTGNEPNEYAYYLQKVYGFKFLIKLKAGPKSTK